MGALSLVFTSFISAAQARPIMENTFSIQNESTVSPNLIESMVEEKMFSEKTLILNKNTSQLLEAVDLSRKQVGKTWYVFSGSTPSGWDCSGLVRWTYSHLDIDLYHSATVQMGSGVKVYTPKFGDIVGFAYNGSSRFYHVGIYIDDDLMLHSGGKRGDMTEFRSISGFAGEHSKVSFTRIVETH
jgi:cell wall-associated NlpC family hydrolase